MPELPEVETVRRQLKPHIIGRKIVDVLIRYQPIIQMNIQTFKSKIIGQRFTDLKRFGKYLLFELDEDTMVSHLRMEGKYYLRESLDSLTKHDHIIFYLDDGLYLTYHDVRKFGTMELTKKNETYHLKSIAKLGPEVHKEKIDRQSIFEKIHHSKRAIKTLLLDQTIVSGLGNIYVDETLFLAKIHPETKGHSLTYHHVKEILEAAQSVVKKAIQLGGTTIRTYQSTLGIDGRFQNELNVHTKKGEPCPRCGESIVKMKVGGRGTYFCPHCQRKGDL